MTKKMVKVIYVTISWIAINPDGNLLNILIKESGVSISLKFGKNHVMMKNPMVTTPAIIWFSVMLDANIPKEIYAMLSMKNPSSVTSTVCMCGVPKQ